ncbi:MAG: hypothetical protein AB7F20_00720 [Geoalkalibacter sp.]|uniref:hypothetical protein n=1 Tax=Geoalkalibacter sp. TaxID=3041440 RepID=UPI003D1439A8
MEDLWKLQKIGYRTNDLADQAEYQQMLKRFREEEMKNNMQDLLYNPPAGKDTSRPPE